jgi:hypothetical protein
MSSRNPKNIPLIARVLSPADESVRALFRIAKREWFSDLARRRPSRIPLTVPVAPMQVWRADPLRLPVQLVGVSPAAHEGSSFKIDPNEKDISRAFRARPFLIVSGPNVLAQDLAWVCPLSTSANLSSPSSLPPWVVKLPSYNGSTVPRSADGMYLPTRAMLPHRTMAYMRHGA